ncbi:MAG: LytR family transcriptional regulator [Solirubrobacterales bacterium]|nr:LytR family transcriptional regulator [Solirubrobacterales bacterium]
MLVAAAIVVAAITLLGGSSGNNPATSAAKATTTAHATHASKHRPASARKTASSGSQAVNPTEESVAVLNGTETTGLAHRISSELQQRGYSQAAALNGRPGGSNQETVVEYASGNQADAEAVAHSLGASKVQPMEAAVASLGGSAKVVVIVGADKATAGP